MISQRNRGSPPCDQSRNFRRCFPVSAGEEGTASFRSDPVPTPSPLLQLTAAEIAQILVSYS